MKRQRRALLSWYDANKRAVDVKEHLNWALGELAGIDVLNERGHYDITTIPDLAAYWQNLPVNVSYANYMHYRRRVLELDH